MKDDLIRREAAIEELWKRPSYTDPYKVLTEARDRIEALPSAQPEIIRCKDCKWWDEYGDYGNGYCMAAKHGCWTEHWDIIIRRTYKGDFYCADAERREDE